MFYKMVKEKTGNEKVVVIKWVKEKQEMKKEVLLNG